MALTRGSGKGIQVIVGTDYNDRDLKRLERDLKRAGIQAKKTQGPMAQLGSGIRKQLTPNLMLAGAAAAAFALKIGVDAVKAAAAEELAVARLATALDNAGEGLALEGVEAGIDRMARATGIADDQLRPAMITLVNATQDAAEAQSLLSLALDVSAGSGRDLSSVSMALAKAANGQLTALRRLGVPLSDAAVKSKDLNAITRELQQTFQGQAARAADTFQGRINRLGVALGELQESLGTGFIEGLEGGAQGTDDLADSIKDLEPLVQALGNQVGSAVKGFGDLVFLAGEGAKQMGLFEGSTQDATGQVEKFVGGFIDMAFANGGALGAVSDLRDYLEDQGIITKSAAESHADYRDAVVRTGDAAKSSVTYVDDLGNEVTQSGEDAEDAAAKFDIFAAAIAKTEQVVAFRQAIDEVSSAFKRGQTPVNIYTEKGQENFDNLKGLIERTASYAESVDGVASRAAIASQGLSSLEGALKNAKMDSGTRALLLEPFQALIDDLRDAGVDVTNLQLKLDRLKSKTITVTTEYRFTGADKRAFYEADGGRIAGRGFGVPRSSDTVPAMLTPGEFVIRKSAVDKFGAGLFSQLNRGINPLAGMGASGSGRAGGFSIGTINVTSGAGERADTSLPRALRRMAFLAGMNG
jgi:uncharacterized protein YukE